MLCTFADNGFAEKCEIFRKINIFLKEMNAQYSDRELLKKIFILAKNTDVSKLAKQQKQIAYSIVNELVGSKYANLLSGVNAFDGIWWFNKELIDSSLNNLFALIFIKTKEKDFEAVKKFYKVICSAKLKAAFKCELFVKQFAPPAKKAKKSTKKVESKVDVKATEKKSKKTAKKSEVKETTSKKKAAKKSESTKK